MEDKVFIIERIEDITKDGQAVGKLVIDASGDAVKVKNPRGSNLKERWGELQVGRAYSFTMGVYTPQGGTDSFPFVKNFVAVEKELAPKIEEQATKPKPIDYRTDDIHNQVAYKIAGWVFTAYVGQGNFLKFTPTEIAVKIGVMAKEIKTAMEQRIEEIRE